jgi:hypothetical protein
LKRGSKHYSLSDAEIAALPPANHYQLNDNGVPVDSDHLLWEERRTDEPPTSVLDKGRMRIDTGGMNICGLHVIISFSVVLFLISGASVLKSVRLQEAQAAATTAAATATAAAAAAAAVVEKTQRKGLPRSTQGNIRNRGGRGRGRRCGRRGKAAQDDDARQYEAYHNNNDFDDYTDNHVHGQQQQMQTQQMQPQLGQQQQQMQTQQMQPHSVIATSFGH